MKEIIEKCANAVYIDHASYLPHERKGDDTKFAAIACIKKLIQLGAITPEAIEQLRREGI